MKSHNIVLLPAAMGAVIMMGAGCNPFASIQQNIAENIAERSIESQTGGKVNVDYSKGTATYQDENGSGSVRVGEGIELPDDFPNDIPQYPGAKYVSAIVMQDGAQAIANFKTRDDAEVVKTWFENELTQNGFTRDMDIPIGFIRIYDNGDVKITVQVQPPQEGETETVASIQRVETK